MSKYGIEMFNSAGRLIFSSEHKTLKVIDSGIISIPSWGATQTINFPPLAERPQLFARLAGYWYIKVFTSFVVPSDDPFWPYPKFDIRTEIYTPYIGAFKKNASGKYSSFTVGTYLLGTSWLYQQVAPYDGVYGVIPAIPYTIFI